MKGKNKKLRYREGLFCHLKSVEIVQKMYRGGVYKVPMVVAYKVPIVVAYKVLNSISKKWSPRFGSRKVCL